MDHLAKALQTALAQNKERADDSMRITERLLDTIDHLTDVLASPQEAATKPQSFEGLLTHIDKVSGNCKLSVDSGERINGVITDPALQLPDNVYRTAFAKDLRVKVVAKTLLDENGRIEKLFIISATLVNFVKPV